MGTQGTPPLFKEIAAYVVSAFMAGEVLNGDLSVADVKSISTSLGSDVVTTHLTKKLKDVIKSTTFGEVSAVYVPPNTRNKANVEAAFQNALTTVLTKKTVNNSITFGDRKSNLLSLILSPAQRNLGPAWYNLGVKTYTSNDYFTSFKVKLESDSNANVNSATDLSVKQIVSNLEGDSNDEAFVNAALYTLYPFDFSATNIANVIRFNNGDSFISGSDIPLLIELFSFSDSIYIVTGARTGNTTATASQVTSALNLTTKIGLPSLLTQIIDTANVPSAVLIKMTDPRINDAFKKAQADIVYGYAIGQTTQLKKFISSSGGYHLYPTAVTDLSVFLNLTGQTSDYLVGLYDSLTGSRTDQNSEDVYTAITSTVENKRKALFYNADNSRGDFTKDIIYSDVLDAYLGYESTNLQDPATIQNDTQLVTYLTSDKLYNAIRNIVDANNNVEATTTENNLGFNQGRGKLRTFLSINKILPITSIISALTQIASAAIKYNNSTLNPEDIIRSTFSTIETNLDKSDFPALQPTTTGSKFFDIPSSTSVAATPNFNERLVIIFAQQNGYLTLNITDNFKFVPLLIKVASSQQKNSQNVYINLQQENYALKVTATTGCPAQTYVANNGGLTNFGTVSNMFKAYKASKDIMGAGEDILLRTFISTTLVDSVVNTALKLDSVFKEFTIERIAAITKTPVDKTETAQFISPITLDDSTTTISTTDKFSNGLSNIVLKGYTSSSAAGYSEELNAFKFTSILVDIIRSIVLSVNKSRKVSELLNANSSARDRFFTQSPLVDTEHQTLFRTLLSDLINNNDEVTVKSWISGKYIRGGDALAGINTAILASAFSSKNLASAVDETSNDKLTIGASGVIRKLAGYIITILNKESYIEPSTKTVEARLKYIDVANLSNMLPGSHAIIVAVAAASSDDLGEFNNRLTESKYTDLKLSGFKDEDLQNSVLAYPKTTGFEFHGIQYKFFVGKDNDGYLVFDKLK